MRKTAGILMMGIGMVYVLFYVFALVFALPQLGAAGGYELANTLPLIIVSIFIVTGGVFCLKRRYWRLCFAAALVALALMILGVVGRFPFMNWAWPMKVVMALPIIFVSIRKSEWHTMWQPDEPRWGD